KKQLFWFFLRWLLCRQKPNVLFVRSAFQHGIQRFGAWRKCGLELSESSIQTELSQSQFLFANLKIKANKIGFWRLNKHKSSTLHLTPHFAKALLWAAFFILVFFTVKFRKTLHSNSSTTIF